MAKLSKGVEERVLYAGIYFIVVLCLGCHVLKQSDDIANRGEVKVEADPDTDSSDVLPPMSRLSIGIFRCLWENIRSIQLNQLLQQYKVNKTK